jgi:hypothetical protein
MKTQEFKIGDYVTIKTKYLTKQLLRCRTENGSTISMFFPLYSFMRVKQVVITQKKLPSEKGKKYIIPDVEQTDGTIKDIYRCTRGYKERTVDVENVLIETKRGNFWTTSEQIDFFNMNQLGQAKIVPWVEL